MQGYATISELAKLTGKHKDTIRRLVKQNKSSKYVIRAKKGYLIDKDWILGHYELTPDKTTSPEAPQAIFNSEDEQEANSHQEVTTDQAKNPNTEQSVKGKQATTKQDINITESLIKTLTDELTAKNQIIKQQQETIQKIVDQQQQLTMGLLSSTNNQKMVENGGNTTPVNPIEEKVIKEKVIKEKEQEGKKGQKLKIPKKKKHWWNKK